MKLILWTSQSFPLPSLYSFSVCEAEVVNYADKRVKHEELVDIEERFQDIWDRYIKKLPGIQSRFEQVQRETRLLEMKIFSIIDISPQDVGVILSKQQMLKTSQ